MSGQVTITIEIIFSGQVGSIVIAIKNIIIIKGSVGGIIIIIITIVIIIFNSNQSSSMGRPQPLMSGQVGVIVITIKTSSPFQHDHHPKFNCQWRSLHSMLVGWFC